MKKNRLWLILAVICLVLGIAAIFGSNYLSSGIQVVRGTNILSEGRNRSLAYDAEKEILYVGTHEGALTAYQGEEVLWTAPAANGAYCKLVLNAAGDKLYTANEGQHVLVYDTSDGSLLLDINTQRMIVGMAVNAEESRIAVVTNTGRSKSNLLVYSIEGEELYNTAYKSSTLRQVEYCADGENLLMANKRGEICLITESGEVLKTYESNYDVKQMKYNEGVYLAVCLDGSYHMLDDEANCIRKGRINNTVNAGITSVGMDASGKYILVGSSEGYIFVVNGEDEQVYVADFDTEITDTAAADGEIYFVGLGGFVNVLSVDGIAMADSIDLLTTVAPIAAYVLFAAFVIFLLAGISKTRVWFAKLFKKMWKQRTAYLFLLPTFIILFFFSYRGIFIGLTRAFTNWSKENNTLAKMEFVGFDNFVAMIEDGYFLIGLKNLLLILCTNLLKTLTVPLLIAWLIYSMRGDKRKYVHRFLFVLPIVVPGVVNVMLWQRIYDPTIGLLNNVLGAVGLENLQRVWLGNADTALWAIIFVGFPFVGALPMLVYYGALGNISEEVIESALMDGAGKWKIFWKIQLPLIKSQLGLMVMLTFISAMQDYSTIYIMTSGGPGTATYVPALELYLNVSQFGKYGYASAMGIVLLIFTLAVTLIGSMLKRKED